MNIEPDYTLINAAESGDVPTVAAWLDINPSLLNDKEWAGTLIRCAVSQNQPAVLRLLFDHGIGTGYPIDGNTLLHLAVNSSDPFAICQLLITEGADSKAMDENGLTPLYYAACRHVDDDIIRLFLAAETPVDLNVAVVLGDLSNIRELLSTDSPLALKAPQPTLLLRDAIWSQGLPPFSFEEGAFRRSAPRDSAEIVRLLLDHGADPNKSWKNHSLPLFLSLSATDFNPAIVQLLLEFGAELSTCNEFGESVLQFAHSTANAAFIQLIEREYQRRKIGPHHSKKPS